MSQKNKKLWGSSILLVMVTQGSIVIIAVVEFLLFLSVLFWESSEKTIRKLKEKISWSEKKICIRL